MHCIDLSESFPTSIYLQNLASIQARTSLVKFARSPRTDPPGASDVWSVGVTLYRMMTGESLAKGLVGPTAEMGRFFRKVTLHQDAVSMIRDPAFLAADFGIKIFQF